MGQRPMDCAYTSSGSACGMGKSASSRRGKERDNVSSALIPIVSFSRRRDNRRFFSCVRHRDRSPCRRAFTSCKSESDFNPSSTNLSACFR